jgi:hypothetical protein
VLALKPIGRIRERLRTRSGLLALTPWLRFGVFVDENEAKNSMPFADRFDHVALASQISYAVRRSQPVPAFADEFAGSDSSGAHFAEAF